MGVGSQEFVCIAKYGVLINGEQVTMAKALS